MIYIIYKLYNMDSIHDYYFDPDDHNSYTNNSLRKVINEQFNKKYICEGIVVYGDVELLQYVHKRLLCPLDKYTYMNALIYQYIDCIQYIDEDQSYRYS